MLKFNPAWRFASPGPAGTTVVNALSDLIGRIAAQGDRQAMLEHFKTYFANSAGFTSNWSSSASWAESDLYDYIRRAAGNAPLLIEAFYDACAALHVRNPEIGLPDLGMVNRVLHEAQAGFRIDPPDLVATAAAPAVAVPDRAPSLDEEAELLIHQSLKQSEQLLAEGRPRQAVQEILWLPKPWRLRFEASTLEAEPSKAGISTRSPESCVATTRARRSTKCSTG
ncbi:hypothetical protein [Methylobacterium oxalidis]|uniref:hypothetical protein n=1 Tax=Methylobacterium oxalidis TaxID=944322 RepID=UPI0033162053